MNVRIESIGILLDKVLYLSISSHQLCARPFPKQTYPTPRTATSKGISPAWRAKALAVNETREMKMMEKRMMKGVSACAVLCCDEKKE
jgi:hypothetical protein